jgi:glycosyltransferase involved in cell wall biosynthesis
VTPIGVVIATRDRPEHLAACLEAVRAELLPGDDVVVADSASRVPVSVPIGVRTVRADAPGASLARNLGWRATDRPVVVFLDDDVRVTPGWRSALEVALTGVDFVCGRVRVPPGQEDVERPVAVTPDVPETLIDAASADVLGVSANLAVRRQVLVRSGGFDERLGPGTWLAAAEDLELLDRLVLHGCVGRYAPAVLAHHEQWRGRRALLALDWGYGKGAGARAVLARRRERSRGGRLIRAALWDNGLQPVGKDLRSGYQFGVASSLTRTAGSVAGMLAVGLGCPP